MEAKMHARERIMKNIFIKLSVNLGIAAVFLGWGWGAKTEPDFIKPTFIDRNIAEAKSKFGTALETNTCDDATTKNCQRKFNEPCHCFKVSLVSEQLRNETLFLTVHKDIIVEFHDGRNALPNLVSTFFPPLKSFTGDSAPLVVIKGSASSANGQIYGLHWKLKEGEVLSLVHCPLVQYGGSVQVKSKLRDCYTRVFRISRLDNRIPEKEKDKDRVTVDY
jgi:hypothetical protein